MIVLKDVLSPLEWRRTMLKVQEIQQFNYEARKLYNSRRISRYHRISL